MLCTHAEQQRGLPVVYVWRQRSVELALSAMASATESQRVGFQLRRGMYHRDSRRSTASRSLDHLGRRMPLQLHTRMFLCTNNATDATLN